MDTEDKIKATIGIGLLAGVVIAFVAGTTLLFSLSAFLLNQ